MRPSDVPDVTRWKLSCDACGAAWWIGRSKSGWDAWCERCQRGSSLAAWTPGTACPGCGAPLTIDPPKFVEAYGTLQNLAAVLAAWSGETAMLGSILPERPRFIADLTPPDPNSIQDAGAREALEALASGDFVSARAWLEEWAGVGRAIDTSPDAAHLWHALAIAAERTGALPLAEVAYTRALERAEQPVARLNRGVLRARRGDLAGAAEDFARAGHGREARWNRAAPAVLEAVATTPGLPAHAALESARAEAGPARPTGAISRSGACCGSCWSSGHARAPARALQRVPTSA